MMRWFQSISRSLRYQPEVWAVYLLGQKFDNIASIGSISKPRYVGLPLRLASYARGLLRTVKLKSLVNPSNPCDILVFAESANQATSLDTTVVNLARNGVSVQFVVGRGAAMTPTVFGGEDCQHIRLGLADLIKVLILNCLRASSILRELKTRDKRLRRWHFDAFLWCHVHLVFFEKLLLSMSPKMILISNDHNTPHRCLIALAREKGIKTIYLQHASVSQLFPALTFDYSLLDGQVAADIYARCEPNRPASLPMPEQRHIFLTGQKKTVSRARVMSSRTIGLACNALDEVKDVIRLIEVFSDNRLTVRLRWHPGMSLAKVADIREACSVISSVFMSDPLVEPVGEFLSQIGVLVATNSSIHLEAAVSGIVPIYYEISPSNVPDYYGYVKNGVSLEATSTHELIELVDKVLLGQLTLNSRAVQAYSTTFDTEWEGREGELAAGIVKALLNGTAAEDCLAYADVIAQDSDGLAKLR